MARTIDPAPHERLTILRGLLEDQEYTLSDEMTYRLLDQMGHTASVAGTRAHLRWLASCNLIGLRETGDLLVATLTQDGMDAARGKLAIDGVARPLPGRA